MDVILGELKVDLVAEVLPGGIPAHAGDRDYTQEMVDWKK